MRIIKNLTQFRGESSPCRYLELCYGIAWLLLLHNQHLACGDGDYDDDNDCLYYSDDQPQTLAKISVVLQFKKAKL